MCHNEIAFCDDDHTGLVVPALGILLHQGAQTRSLGRNERVVLDVVGREPPFQRSEVTIGKGLSEEYAHDGFVAQRVVRHVSRPPSIVRFFCAQSGHGMPALTQASEDTNGVLLKPSGVAAPAAACGSACRSPRRPRWPARAP